MNRQEQLDRLWHDTGYEELGIGFAHDQPISAKEDMNGLICSCHLPLTPAAALGIAKGIIAEMEKK